MFLAIWFCSWGLKQFGKFQNHTVWLLKQGLGSFAWEVIVCTTKVRDEPLEMEKELKIKKSVSSPPSPPTKYWGTDGGTVFIKKLCMGEQTFLGKYFGGCFAWGIMIRSCKGELMVNKRFQRSIPDSFSSYWPDLGYLYSIWKVNTTNKGLN